jgi:hypothetical protein
VINVRPCGDQPAIRLARAAARSYFHRVLIDHRTQVDVAVERIADLDLPGLLNEQTHELVANRLAHVDARAGRALLTLSAERRSHDAVARLVEIGGLHHERRVLAAHFDNERPRHRTRGVVADQVHADVLRAGEHDAIDVRVVDELLSGRAPPAGDEVEDTRRETASAITSHSL